MNVRLLEPAQAELDEAMAQQNCSVAENRRLMALTIKQTLNGAKRQAVIAEG
jgi:hypothetical protein